MTHPRQGAWRNRAPRPWAPGGQGVRPGRGDSEAVMLILLSDGAGLTARQCATVLARAGHRVEALSPAGLCLCRMTRHVRRVHDVPALGRDPSAWLEAALDVAALRGADVLLPVQEQVAVMAMARDRIEA